MNSEIKKVLNKQVIECIKKSYYHKDIIKCGVVYQDLCEKICKMENNKQECKIGCKKELTELYKKNS